MSEFLNDYGALILVVIYAIIVKIRRHSETKEKDGRRKGVEDAENMVLAIANGLRKREPDPLNQVQLLNEIVAEVPDKNVYRRALIDGISKICETEPEKKFTPVKGEHPLQTLADRAVKAEQKKEKIVRGLKKAGQIGLSILKAAI